MEQDQLISSTVVKELRSASSGFSLTPESRPSVAAVEAEKHNPKVAGKKKRIWGSRTRVWTGRI
jgi:hypothetical protein